MKKWHGNKSTVVCIFNKGYFLIRALIAYSEIYEASLRCRI